MTQETERENFEAWTAQEGLDHLARGFGKDDGYDFVETRRMWSAWQARAALEVKQADVQMPDPFTTLVRKNSWSTNCYEASPLSNHRDYGRLWADERVNVYTEQQVRQLLADHGIKIAD